MEVPFDDALLFLYSKGEEDSERLPEKMAEKRENLGKLQIAFASLTDDEKELEVKANVFYNHNHPTYEYKYCIDDYYFNFDDLGE